ncbi:acyl-CoA dehydrogenase family protein [Microbacterium sp. X-17]|uniref:acyl-CoA dehydrogenase family protein n=1 Tax=Microbacterium sp. X-17 TaxID=3144404 RepID=UPI0031F54258
MAVRSPGFTSFTDPGIDEFVETLREELRATIPESWEAVKDLPEFHPANHEARRQFDRNRNAIGLGQITWPEPWGAGFGPVEEVLYNEVWGELEAPLIFNVVGRFAGRALSDWGSEAQKEYFLPRILNDDDIWCEGFSEPGGGADMANYKTRATRTESGWHITGEKIWTSSSPQADRMYCLAITDPNAPKRHNLSVFALNMHSPGVVVEPIKDITGISEFGHVHIDTDVPDSDLLGEEGQGWAYSSLVGAQRQRGPSGNAERSSQMGAWARRLQRTFDAAPETTKQRLRGRVDEVVLRVRGYQQQIRRAVTDAIAGRETFPATAPMKIYWTELTQEMTDLGLELAGPADEAYWRGRHLDFRKVTIATGPNEVHRDIVANRVLGMGRDF